MGIFQTISGVTEQVSGLLQSTRGLIDKSQGKGFGEGFKGMVQSALDLNIEGLMAELDMRVGTGIMRLTIAGDSGGVETAARFRSHAAKRLDELLEMREIVNRFISTDITQIREATAAMEVFLDSREPEVECSAREEALKERIRELQEMNRKMAAFLESEAESLEEDRSRKAEPEVGPAEPPARATAPPVTRITIGNDRHTRR